MPSSKPSRRHGHGQRPSTRRTPRAAVPCRLGKRGSDNPRRVALSRTRVLRSQPEKRGEWVREWAIPLKKADHTPPCKGFLNGGSNRWRCRCTFLSLRQRRAMSAREGRASGMGLTAFPVGVGWATSGIPHLKAGFLQLQPSISRRCRHERKSRCPPPSRSPRAPDPWLNRAG
jgi:hypothetical protein